MKKILKKALQGLSLEQQKLLQPYLHPDLTGLQNSFAFPNTFQNNISSPAYPTSQTPIVSDNPTDFQQEDSFSTKRMFGFNPGMYGALYGANTALIGISNNVENVYQKQNLIQNRLNPLPQVGSRSNTDKYGYGFGNSFGAGGTKQNPPKIYTNATEYNKAANNYNDSLALYNYTQLQKKLEGVNPSHHNQNAFEKFAMTITGGDTFNHGYMNDSRFENGKQISLNQLNNKNLSNDRLKAIKEIYNRQPDSIKQKIPLDDYIKRQNILFNTTDKLVKTHPNIAYDNFSHSPDIIHKDIVPQKSYWGFAENYDYSNAFPKQPVVYKPDFKPRITVNTSKGQVSGTQVAYSPDKKNVAVWDSQFVPKNNHPINKMQALHPANIGMDDSQVFMQGQPINLPKAQLPQQHGKPIYGPGSTIVGYSDEQMNFKPAYQYTGAPNNEHNLQDKQLLNDPEALKKYIASRDSGYKFVKGGKTSPYKMGNVPNSVNFNGLTTTEYNEPNMSPITLDNMTNLLQLVDPTGISSYPDIYNSKTPEQRAVAMASAIPAFGRLAKVVKGTKQGTKILQQSKAINLIQNGLNITAPMMQNQAPYGLPGRANIYEQGGDLGNYFDRYFDKAYTTKVVDAKNKPQQGLDVTESPRLTTDIVEQGGYDMTNDYLGLFSDSKSPFRPKRQNMINSSQDDNESYNPQPNNGDWASKFRQVEDPQGKFDHGNGAYGSFGYRKSGHLQTAFKSAPEFSDLRQNYKNFNNFWNDFKDDNYGQLSQIVDGKYENWLKKQSNGDLNIAGNFNLTGSKHPAQNWMVGNNMSPLAYNKKLTKQGDGGIIKDPFNLSKKVYLNNKNKSTSSTSVQTESNNDVHYIDTATLANLKTANVKFNFI